eukprot:snap_masked-scaffold_39-processed-gene-1.42-mRNA-1 protein AED:1.00 eAED:1.00 QI:0/-1/0/0/-1/1/1/0/86
MEQFENGNEKEDTENYCGSGWKTCLCVILTIAVLVLFSQFVTICEGEYECEDSGSGGSTRFYGTGRRRRGLRSPNEEYYINEAKPQ